MRLCVIFMLVALPVQFYRVDWPRLFLLHLFISPAFSALPSCFPLAFLRLYFCLGFAFCLCIRDKENKSVFICNVLCAYILVSRMRKVFKQRKVKQHYYTALHCIYFAFALFWFSPFIRFLPRCLECTAPGHLK